MPVHEPGTAFRALPDDPTPVPLQRCRHRRVVFAVALFITTVTSFAINEALHWRLGVDLGFSFRPVSAVVDHVVPGGIADHAGVQVGRHLWAVDDERVWIAGAWHGERYGPEGRDLLVDSDGRAALRVGSTVPVLLRFNTLGEPTCVATDVEIQATAPPRWLRLSSTFFILPWLLPVAVLLSLLAMWIAGAVYRPSTSLAASLRQRERSVRWLAFVTTVVVPLIGHVYVIAAVGEEHFWSQYLGVAVMMTSMPHLMLLRTTMRNASRVLDGELVPEHRAPFIIASVVPGLLLVVPTVLTLGIGLPLLQALRRDAHRVA
jgi:hypothetical protein